MSWTVSESNNEVMRKNQVNSPSIDEGGCCGSMAGGSRALKKGPWTSMEDAILVDYVKKHGEGNWNAVQKHSGLLRCGKSCRLRWANHLRPNLKKGAFTQEEEQLIIELHARMGNKWARMAAHLPGRTDNEIKNYWNTRIKRLQRAGLPLYPSNVFPGSNENEQSQGDDEFSSGEKQHNDFLQGSNYEIPEFKIDNLVANQGVLSYAPLFPEISLNNMLSQGTGSQNYGFMSPTVSHTKQLQDSETLFPGFHGNISGLPTLEQSPNEPPEKIHHTLGLGYQYDTDPVTKSPMPLGGGIPGNHAFLNGNYSASRPLPGTVKLELPSLQYTVTDHSGWLTSPSTTPELVDTYIQSPPVTQLLQYDCVSPQNSGLLEAMLQGAQTLGIAKKRSSQYSSNFSVVTPSEMAGRSTINICETDWEGYNDPVSPLGHSAASVFDACTPPMSGSSMDELSPPKAPSGLDALMATGKCGSTLSIEESPLLPCSEFLRPDALLGSDWFEASSQITGDHCMMNDAIATLLGEDLCNNYKNAPSGMSSTFGQGNEFHSYPWNNMPMSHV